MAELVRNHIANAPTRCCWIFSADRSRLTAPLDIISWYLWCRDCAMMRSPTLWLVDLTTAWTYNNP